MTPEEQTIIDALTGTRWLTTGEISQLTGIPRSRVLLRVKSLERYGFIRSTTEPRGGRPMYVWRAKQ